MASIPLPALDVKTPQQPDMLQKYGQLMQLKQMQQQTQMQQQEAPLRVQALNNQVQSSGLQVQQQQQALKDQQAMTAAMQQWDGKNIDDLTPLVIKNGGSATAVMGLKQKSLEMKQTYSKIAADDATTGAKRLETMKGNNDLIAGALSPLIDPKQTPDEQLPQAVLSTAQDLQQKGLLDPQHMQTAQQIAQSGDPTKIRQQLSILQKSYMGMSAQMDEAQKEAATRSANATAAKSEMDVSRGGSTDVDKFESDYLKSNNLPDTPQNRVKAFQEYTRETKIAPAQVRVEGYGQTKEYPVFDHKTGLTVMVTPTEINRASAAEPGRYTAASYTPESVGAKDTTNYFTKGKGGQQVTAFNTAIDHLNTLGGLANDLGNSNIQIFNKAAQAWAQQTGNPAPTNFEAAKNAMAGEVASALKASGATDQEIEKVDQTFDRAQSPGQLKGAIATYRTLLNGKMSNLKKQYGAGMQGKPAFDNPPAQGGMVTVQIPGSPAGQIPASALTKFKADHPNAQVQQ